MVNFSGISIEPDAIVDYLKQELSLKEICQKVLYQILIKKAAQSQGIIVTPEEIQVEADRQRYQKRLESAAATFAWLNEQLITPNEWETGIQNQLIMKKLAESLFAQDVEKYFAEHRLDFEQISLYKITVPYKELAQELRFQLEEGEISFFEAAHLYDVDEQRRLQCGYEGRLYRWSLNPEIAAAIFSATIGEVLGPFQNDQGFELLMVEELIEAELNPTVRQEIIDRMFQEWLQGELTYFIHNQS
ncbi:MAG TPA: peptidylprolyl isomerase [Trichocoleus sp.]|jgi:parvulin-like peptidyl-prolyl isomerase